jgi:hypothetical protein
MPTQEGGKTECLEERVPVAAPEGSTYDEGKPPLKARARRSENSERIR